MNEYTCTCLAESDEQKCKLHKKSRYRNPWKREDEEPMFADGEDE